MNVDTTIEIIGTRYIPHAKHNALMFVNYFGRHSGQQCLMEMFRNPHIGVSPFVVSGEGSVGGELGLWASRPLDYRRRPPVPILIGLIAWNRSVFFHCKL
jgi:hypothetical protein